MMFDQYIQYIGWTCTLLCLLTFWLLRPRPKRMPEPPKPTPYASARGSRPPAPWVTREEFDELRCHVGMVALAADQVRIDELERQVMALESYLPKPAPEPLAPGVRVWRRGQHVRLTADGCFWGRESDSSWYTFEASERWTMEHCAELHDHERDEVVKDWMNRGNV